MYLKSLELQGFKSFPDKTLLTFEKDVTAIVGPNGSGKSNIADAIRWVLGEQSTKTLRGTRMEDVVFSGTSKRGPVGYAEVSLTIDNSDRKLNVDYSELTVTRRYYRSGESEFYINRKAARLRDIHELFMDTGLGRDGYSIIGQGRIDEILSIKSTDRRDFFEEAAGISKFRYRREEALKKLAAADENLVRVKDIVAELETQVGPLAEQAEKAKKFLLFRDELRALEVSLWLDALDRLQAGLVKARADSDAAEERLAASRAELDALYRESEGLAASMHEKDVEGERLYARLSAASGEVSSCENEISILRTKIAGNLDNIMRIERETADAQGRADSLSAQIEEKRRRAEELLTLAEDAEKELRELSEKASEAARQTAETEKRIDGLAASASVAALSAASLRADESAARSAASEISSRMDESAKELTLRTAALDEERKKADETERLLAENSEKRDGVKNMMTGFELRLRSRTKKYEESAEKRQTLDIKLKTLSERAAMLAEMEREGEGLSRAVRSVKAAAARARLSGIRGTVASIIKAPDEYVTAIETALGGALSDIVTETEEDAKSAVSFLKRTDGGRATFLPLSSVRGQLLTERGAAEENGIVGIASELISYEAEYEGVVRSLLGRTLVAENIDAGIRIQRKYGQRLRIVTTDGQMLNPGGSITGGSAVKNSGILSRANELERLKKEKTALEDALDAASREESAAMQAKTAAAYDLEVAAGELRVAEDEVIRLSAERDQRALLIESMELSAASLKDEAKRGDARVSELLQKAEELSSAAAQKEAAAEAMRTEAAALTEGRAGLSVSHGDLLDAISAKRAEAAELAVSRESALSAAKDLSELLSQLSGDVGRRGELIDGCRAENARLTALADEKEKILESRRESCASAKADIERLNAEKLRIEELRVKKDREAQSKNDELLALERERARFEQKLQQSENEERQITDRLWENYELTRVAAQAVRIELENTAKASRRASELRNSIRALGSVNLAAVDEYARVGERYEFLCSQRDDIEKGRAELIKLTDEIGRHMKDVFSTQFKLINERFGETFREIFGGGSAALELTDPSDILSCGIDINVTLPGKSKKAITLLSGGERAFVAIALYFAILKVRPTPFCVLDEIESSLDDVNVDRYAEYMHTLCGSTQFIVITHRRGTMEKSEMLYGVTMQERGVSKLLALSIADVEKQLDMKLE